MSMRMELSDLPPKYRAQAEAQIAARCRAKAPTLEAVAAAAKKTGREFDSRGEYDYYMGMILPKVQRGEIVKVESHRRFTMLPEKEYGNVKLPAMHYTPDFVLTYADGTVEVVEVKSKFTRRQQRDYISPFCFRDDPDIYAGKMGRGRFESVRPCWGVRFYYSFSLPSRNSMTRCAAYLAFAVSWRCQAP